MKKFYVYSEETIKNVDELINESLALAAKMKYQEPVDIDDLIVRLSIAALKIADRNMYQNAKIVAE